jgi:predicted NACHT family NTPase
VDLHLPDIPIYIELSTAVTSEAKDLLDVLVSQWQRYTQAPAEIARLDLEQAIQNGKVLLLLDGLDETAVGSDSRQARQAYSRVLQLIQSFVDAHDHEKLYIVVTARKAAYYNQDWHRLQGFTELEMASLTPENIKHFIENWFKASEIPSPERIVKSLLARLQRNKPIEQLATNPLLLTLIILVYHENRALPGKKAELYDHCVDALLRSWDTNYKTIERVHVFSAASKNEDKLLARIAWHLHNKGWRYCPRQEMLDVIAEFLHTLNPTVDVKPERNSEEILNLMLSTHNLIVQQAQDKYGFSHLTFQEYFVAVHIRDNFLLDVLLENVHKSWWEEVVLLYANLAPDVSPLLRALLIRSQSADPLETLFHASLLLAGRCLGTATFLNDGSLRTTILDQLCSLLESTPYAYLQRQIADIVVRVGDVLA